MNTGLFIWLLILFVLTIKLVMLYQEQKQLSLFFKGCQVYCQTAKSSIEKVDERVQKQNIISSNFPKNDLLQPVQLPDL